MINHAWLHGFTWGFGCGAFFVVGMLAYGISRLRRGIPLGPTYNPRKHW